MSTFATRSAAAHKAVATRRANQLAKKRSAAALKAWATRRAQAAFAVRSAAAHKAWATRRKMKGNQKKGITTNCVACEANTVENYEPPSPLWNAGCGYGGLTLEELPVCEECRQSIEDK